jgi:glutathionyl-hydroquinone reductase
MGLLINGSWKDQWYDTKQSDGHFVRQESAFRNQIERDPKARFPAQPNRYHLYVSYACPWAHRTLIFRKLKNLESCISVSVVDPLMGEHGWVFTKENPELSDHLYQKKYLYEIYTKAQSDFTGRVTVPILWDKETHTIVNNESAEIIRILNQAFDSWGDASLDFYPQELRAEIDEVNDWVYDQVNNGVYKCGFATTQHAYETAFDALFKALDSLEERLSKQRYLVGNRLTEADWRLFTTLVRFDSVYVGHFKCNQRRIADYPHLWNYTRELFQTPGVASTVHMNHIKEHYYRSHPTINPSGVVPKGPALDFTLPHDRLRF